ncbi:hypothetical protein [Novosphingobium humi]|uniref:Uncharacterized protein n=1 Tax=Novosphingobium humi TaxID=2282397 RepID=A0ABY7U6P8_9SPHN|nr:hypothetical protein [Novosphingobium humi]WCT80245.1 hypothetical protein PQ457_22125 [Novosphingobium humi]
MKKIIIITTMAAASISQPVFAKIGVARVVQCEISGDQGVFTGPCAFTPYEHGDFSVARLPGKRFYGRSDEIYLAMDAPGKADAEITDGVTHSRWGTMLRSKVKPACWIDAEDSRFKVCAY